MVFHHPTSNLRKVAVAAIAVYHVLDSGELRQHYGVTRPVGSGIVGNAQYLRNSIFKSAPKRYHCRRKEPNQAGGYTCINTVYANRILHSITTFDDGR